MKIITFKNQSDYNKVDVLPFNRKVVYRRDLASKMRKYGFVGSIILIQTDIITGKLQMFIADGSHRFLIATSLGMEFIGTMVEREFKSLREIVEFVASLNSTQLKWYPGDYVSAYAYLNVESYKKLMRIKSTCPFTFVAVACMLRGIRTRGTIKADIQNGTFKAIMVKETVATLKYLDSITTDERIVNNRMALSIHYVRSLSLWNEDKFTKMWELHYNDIKGKNLDDYTDIFMDWLS